MEKMLKENNIKAKVIQHTKHPRTETEMITVELDMPRVLLAELNTHKILVRNAQSSRAVPIKTVLKNLREGHTYFCPSYWGKNVSGMSAVEENHNNVDLDIWSTPREVAWESAMIDATYYAEAFMNAGYHKQVVGRLLEPFMMVKVLLSGTEWDNFFNLRIEPNAEPHFRDLAIKIYNAIQESKPFELKEGEYHLPYINLKRLDDGSIEYSTDREVVSKEDAISISLSCAAQTSYRKHDDSIEKARSVVEKLFNGDVVHASPAEHIATPIIKTNGKITCREGPYLKFGFLDPTEWEEGVTHIDKDANFWSGQLKHFVQYRQLIPNNACKVFTNDKFNQYMKRNVI